MVRKMKSPRRLAALAIFAIIAMSAFGFAATNSVAPSNAGDGHAAVSGGNVQAIHYVVTPGSPAGLAAVQFNYVGYSDKPTFINAVLTVAGSPVTSSCSNGAGDAWSCSFLGVNVEDVTDLQVTSFD